MNAPKYLPAYNLSNGEHIKALFDMFGAEHSLSLLSEFWAMVKEFDDDGCQDCFRARYVGSSWDEFSTNEDKINHIMRTETKIPKEYQSMIGCCGSVDRIILLGHAVWVIGCNFGH